VTIILPAVNILTHCDGTYKMLFIEGRFVDCTIEDTKLKREEEKGGGA